MSGARYTGGCHCGAVRFEVNLEVKEGMACNCSICSRVGWLLAFVPDTEFRLLQGDAALADYQFGKKNLHHPFCATCGIHTFSRGPAPDGKVWCGINLRCLDDVPIDQLTIKQFDGKRL